MVPIKISTAYKTVFVVSLRLPKLADANLTNNFTNSETVI
jgi:hypothetical protein